jgi:aminopeptidase N
MWTQYYDSETTYAMERDSLATVQKIQQDVHTPDEIQTLFDPAIVYSKGGSLLNMLHAYLGADAFRDGLRMYLQRHQYTNTEADDLWKALGEVSGHDVVGFMRPWISQAGYPMITVGDGSSTTINLHQRRFFSNPKEAGGNDQTIWPMPLLADGQLQEELLDQPSASLQLQSTEHPLLLNQGRTGYYLTMYDSDHTAQLATEVQNGKMAVIDRMGLLSDGLSLSEAGLQPHLAALQLLQSYRHESSQPVWGAITSHIGTLKMFADDDEALLAALRKFVRDLAVNQHQRLGWEPINGESYFDALLRPTIIAHMAYAEDEEIVAKLRQLFANAQVPSDIWGDIRSIAFAVAAKYDGEPAFQKLLDWHHTTASAEQRTQLISGMCAIRDPKLIERVLGMLTTDAVKLQDLFYWIVYLSRSRFARDQTWQWMQDNWQWIVNHFGNDMHYTDFPKYMANAFSKPAQLESYKQFFEPMLDIKAISRTISQGIEDIEGRILWRERDGQAVAEYLADCK